MRRIKEIAADFACYVEATTDATERGDPFAAHTSSKLMEATGQRLLEEFGDAGVAALAVLLGHDRSDVRIEAASQLLGHRTEAAIRILEQEAAGGDVLAEMALKNWRSSDWNVGP